MIRLITPNVSSSRVSLALLAAALCGLASANAAPAATKAKPKATPKAKPKATPKPTPKPTATPALMTSVIATSAAVAPSPSAAPSATPTTTAPTTATATTTSATSSTPSAEIVATVNDEAILKKDVDRLFNAARLRDKTLQGESDAAKKKRLEARQQIVTDRIDLALWTQEAKRRKISAPAGDVDKYVAQNRSQFRSDAEWNAFLGGRSLADYRRILAQEMAMTELFTRLTADVKISDDEIKAYYDANRSQFTAPEMVRVHHIFFVLPKNANEAESARVMSMADEVLKKAQAPGANFEALAREHSQANDVMEDSGGLPLFWRDRIPLPKEFQEAAFGGATGQVVGPVRTAMGVHIIKIDEKIPPSPAPLSFDLKSTIRLALKTQKNDALLKQTLNDLKNKADIQMK